MKKLILVTVLLMSVSACTAEQEQEAVVESNEDEMTVEVNDSEPASESEEGTVEIVYNMEEVALHGEESSCWSAIDGKVYDLTDWISKHPGGARNILKICGKDGSAAFSGQHGGNAGAAATLSEYYLSDLQ